MFPRRNEFNINLIKQKMLPSGMNICAKDDHIHMIERSIRTVKEWSWCNTHIVAYTSFPIVMTKSLFQYWVSWLNSFLPTNIISDTISPATVVLGKTKPYLSKQKICFGAYAITYTNTNNYMTARGVTAIVLR